MVGIIAESLSERIKRQAFQKANAPGTRARSGREACVRLVSAHGTRHQGVMADRQLLAQMRRRVETSLVFTPELRICAILEGQRA
jgi:hypothetical protein